MGATKQSWIKRKANGNGIPWNKGKKLALHTQEHNIKISDGLKKSYSNKERTGFVKGQPTWNKGLKGYRAGELNNKWKGGITPINYKIRQSHEYKEWRDAVYQKDKWTCQECGIKCQKGNIVAHHLISFSDRIELRFVIGNGQVLCRPCHARIHSEERNIARILTKSKLFNSTVVA